MIHKQTNLSPRVFQKETADLFSNSNPDESHTETRTHFYRDQHVAAAFHWLPDYHSFYMMSLWNRRW